MRRTNCLFFAVVILLSFNSAAKSAAKNGKAQCSKRNLDQRDCVLRAGTWRLILSSGKVLVDDGVWRWAFDIPLIGEKMDWRRAEFHLEHGRPFLQMQIWDEPKGELQLQDLHWFAIELVDKTAKTHFDEVIQHRKLSAKTKEVKTVEYVLDPIEKHGLVVGPKSIKWFVGSRHKP